MSRSGVDARKILKEGLVSHHENTNIMNFKDDDGNLAKNDAENAKIDVEYLLKFLIGTSM